MADVLVFVESNTTGTGRLFAERARELGLVPYMICRDASRYPYLSELGIAFHECATDSQEAVLAACRSLAAEHALKGITSSSEYFISTAAGVADALGLPSENPAVLSAARDKRVQRRRFAACGVNSPEFRTASSAREAVVGAEALGLPVVVKPVDRSGSLGVRRCDTVEEVSRHAGQLLANLVDERGRPLPASVLVEAYLDGPEYSVEVLDGEMRAVTAKHLDQTRGFLEIGHDVPAPVDEATRALLIGSTRAALAALGLRWGAAHVELRMTQGRASVVEVNPRLAGGMIPQAIQAATGQDLIAELMALTAGLTPVRGPVHEGCAAIRFVVPDMDGEVRTVPDTTAALQLPGVVAAGLTARTGQRVTREGTFLDRLGHVIAGGDTAPQAADRADQAVKALSVELVPYRTKRAQP